MTQVTVALNKLILSDLNMRLGEVDVADLVASMKARVAKGLSPLIQNLAGTMQLNAQGKETGVVEIHVGGRRLRALNELATAKAIKKTQPVTVTITASRDEAVVESSEENDARLPPHPVDQYLNFARMIEQGHTPADIAARFNIAPVRVQRRLKLAKVSPRLLDLYREGVLDADQMAAFTLTDDHAEQEAAYFEAPEGWQRNANSIRQRITNGEVDAARNRLARFVGLDAYRAAGGTVRLDLFAAEGEGYIQDIALLHKLAGERLSAETAQVEGEGWKWVRAEVEVNWQETDAMGRVYPVENPLPDDVLAQIEQLSERYQAMEAEGLGETDEGADEMDALETQIATLQKSAGSDYLPEDKALAGVLFYLENDGRVGVRRGLVAVEDKKAHKAMQVARESAEALAAAADGQTGGLAAIQAETAGEGLSATLRENLSAHHSMALRAALIDNPAVALTATVHRLLLVGHYRGNMGARDIGAVRVEGLGWNETLDKHVSDIRETTAGQRVEAARVAMAASLPADPAQLWDYLLALPQVRLLDILAYAASHQVYAVQAQYAPQARTTSGYQLAEALSLDMADHWTPTVPGYFGRVGKPEIVAAVREAKGDDAAEALSGLKKGEMAEQAATLLADSRWVPTMLRTRGVNQIEAEATDAAAEADQLAEAREPSNIPVAA